MIPLLRLWYTTETSRKENLIVTICERILENSPVIEASWFWSKIIQGRENP